MIEKRIEEITENGYTLDISAILSNTFEILKKIIGFGILITLLFGIIYLVSFSVSSEILLINLKDIFTNYIQVIKTGSPERIEAFIKSLENSNFKYLPLLTGLFVAIFGNPILYSLLHISKKVETNQPIHLSDIFYNFTHRYFNFIVVQIIIFILISMGNLFLAGNAKIYYFLVSTYIYIGSILATPFVMFTNLSFGQALTNSFKIVHKNFFMVLLVSVLLILIYFLVTSITCGLGILIMHPFQTIGTYVIFKYIIGPTYFIDPNDELDNIGV